MGMKDLWALSGRRSGMMKAIRQLLCEAGEQWICYPGDWTLRSYNPEERRLKVVELDVVTMASHKPAAEMQFDRVIFVEYPPGKDTGNIPIVEINCQYMPGARRESIIQVVELLEEGGTFQLSEKQRRWIDLIAANYINSIPGMQDMQVTDNELAQILRFCDEARNETPGDEAEARAAIAAMEVVDGLTTIKSPHAKWSIYDELLYGQPGPVLITCEVTREVCVFADGALRAAIYRQFQGFEHGSHFGKSGQNAYWWGYLPECDGVHQFILHRLAAQPIANVGS
jgi:hypothetical protein